MSSQQDLFKRNRDLFTDEASAEKMELSQTIQEDALALAGQERERLYHFAHPYPRFGLAYTFFHHGIRDDLRAIIDDEERLADLAADVIEDNLSYVRLHTETSVKGDGEVQATYRYVARDELKTSGQTAQKDPPYFLAPHVATGDTGTNNLIRAARKLSTKLRGGEKFYADDRKLKNSFSPFTKKINEGGANLNYPKADRFQVVFTLIATLALYKPAAQVDFVNQVIIPDLDVERLIDFIDLFYQLHEEQGDVLTLERQEGKKRRRPPIYDGNYPGAPRNAIFGPVGLMAAMGRWIRGAETTGWAEDALEAIPEHPLYLVSDDQSLMKQVRIGEHVSRLALQHDLPKALNGLYHARHYISDHNAPDDPQGKLFDQMANRFLQSYTRPAFRDFLAFRAEYAASFSLILEDYFMRQYETLSEDLVRSARAYGKYLNRQAWEAGVKEEKTKDTGRDAEKAQTNVLNQMESIVMSSERPSEIFARLNREARQIDNYDAPDDAGLFVETAIANPGMLQTTKELILAFMRLRTTGNDSVGNTSEDDPMMPKN